MYTKTAQDRLKNVNPNWYDNKPIKFVDNANGDTWKNLRTVFEIDQNLKTRISRMGAALMRILLERYTSCYNSTVSFP